MFLVGWERHLLINPHGSIGDACVSDPHAPCMLWLISYQVEQDQQALDMTTQHQSQVMGVRPGVHLDEQRAPSAARVLLQITQAGRINSQNIWRRFVGWTLINISLSNHFQKCSVLKRYHQASQGVVYAAGMNWLMWSWGGGSHVMLRYASQGGDWPCWVD